MSKSNIVIQLTGSIACYKACTLISTLVQNNYHVQTVVTNNALKFIGISTLEALSKRPVMSDMFASRDNIAHIELNKWANLFLLYPASANTINKMAAGIADDLVSTLFLSNNFQHPYWIAPAMNVQMLAHPATQRSLATLQEWGAKILDAESGYLACGDQGKGRLIAPETVFKLIEERA